MFKLETDKLENQGFKFSSLEVENAICYGLSTVILICYLQWILTDAIRCQNG